MKKLLWMLLLVLPAAPLWADEEADRIRAVEIGRKSVVSLRVYRSASNKPGVGSGIIMRSDGFILTNSHVVEGAKVVRVGLPGGKQYNGRIWSEAKNSDLALVKIEATGLPVASIGNSDAVKLGQTAIAIGDPLGFSGTVTVGTVGGMGRDIKVGQIKYPAMIQTDAAINPGSSGGALINIAGEVIGVNTLIYNGPNGTRPSQGLGFAIPINHARSVAVSLVAKKPASSGKAWLGVNGANLSQELSMAHSIPARRGVLVTSVVPGSPADMAGMRVGDAIVSCGPKSVLSVTDFLSQIAARKPGDTVELGIWRQGKKTTVKVVLDVAGS